MTEVFRVGKEKVVAAPQHGYLVGALEFLGQASRLAFDIRKAPLACLGRNRFDERPAAFLMEETVEAAEEVNRCRFTLANGGDEFGRPPLMDLLPAAALKGAARRPSSLVYP